MARASLPTLLRHTLPGALEQVRSTYDGPLAMATDYMVINVTKDDIRTRMAAIDEDIWPQPAVGEKLPPDASNRIGFSDYIEGGRVVFEDVVKRIYEETNEKFGSNVQPPL